MRAKIIVPALLILIGLFWLLRLPPFPSPSHHRDAEAGETAYVCGEEVGAETLWISFLDKGWKAVVRIRDRRVVLDFSHTTLFEDVYTHGPWKLTLDPEANFHGPHGLHTFNCS